MNSDAYSEGSAGFTLIELMVVMGLIVLFVGGFGAVVHETSDQALRGAQLQVASLLERARLVAVSQQSDARLVIDAGDSDRFMRVLQVFYLDAAGIWNAASPVVWLPHGIRIVPPSGVGAIDPWVNFSACRSVLALDLAPRLTGEEFEGATRTAYVEYAATATLRTPEVNPCRIALAGITATPAGTLAPASNALRLVTIQANGTVALDTTGLAP